MEDANGTDDAVEQSVKDAKDQEIADHQNTKQELIDSFDDAARFRDEKIANIQAASDERERLAYEKEKQKRDEAYYDLEGLMLDEEGQLNGLIADVDYWDNERLVALGNDDMELYKEFQGYFEEA